jgi:alanine racemase
MSRLNVTIDYTAITTNVAALAARTTADVMAVVKADAYGHGLVASAAAARTGGAGWLGVAQPQEALDLRAAGDSGAIFTWLYGPDDMPAHDLVAADVDVSVSSIEVLAVVIEAARDTGRTARIHIGVDTGLGREGCAMAQLPALVDAVAAAQRDGVVDAVGMWSHLAWADQPGHPTIDAQAATFRAALDMASAAELPTTVRHLANSACTLTRPDLHFDVVRPGIAVYGLPPVADPDGANWGLRPAMRVTSRVVAVKSVDAGQGVSYGHTYVTEQATTLALVSAGYADGVFRSASNAGPVTIRGQRYTVSGRVCMDQFVVDVGQGAPVAVGDEVVLVGPDGPSATEWADAAGTIDYEVVCRFGIGRIKGIA